MPRTEISVRNFWGVRTFAPQHVVLVFTYYQLWVFQINRYYIGVVYFLRRSPPHVQKNTLTFKFLLYYRVYGTILISSSSH